MFNQNIASNVAFPIFLPFLLWLGSVFHDTLQTFAEAKQAQCRITCYEARLTERKITELELELQLS